MEILLFLQSIRNDILTTIFTGFTIATETIAVTLISAIMYWCIDKKCGQRLLFALTSSITINSGVKNVFKSKRPIGSAGLESLRTSTATGYSFPSGHTQTSTTLWVVLMSYFKKIWIYVLGTVLILGAGISRLYLGVHWPIDVLFGWIFGIVISLVFVKIFDYIDENKKYYILIILLILFGAFTYYFVSDELVKSFAIYTGFALGYIIEDKFVKFSTDESHRRANIFTERHCKQKISTKILRFILGIVSLGLVYLLMKLIKTVFFATSNEITLMIVDYVRYSILAFYGVAIVPALFKVFKLD